MSSQRIVKLTKLTHKRNPLCNVFLPIVPVWSIGNCLYCLLTVSCGWALCENIFWTFSVPEKLVLLYLAFLCMDVVCKHGVETWQARLWEVVLRFVVSVFGFLCFLVVIVVETYFVYGEQM